MERLSAYARRTLTRFRFAVGTAIGFAKFTIGRGDETDAEITLHHRRRCRMRGAATEMLISSRRYELYHPS